MRVFEMQRIMGPLATEAEAREMIQLVAERNYTVRVDGDSHPEWREMIEEAIRRAALREAA
jgi:hypothetical protein